MRAIIILLLFVLALGVVEAKPSNSCVTSSEKLACEELHATVDSVDFSLRNDMSEIEQLRFVFSDDVLKNGCDAPKAEGPWVSSCRQDACFLNYTGDAIASGEIIRISFENCDEWMKRYKDFRYVFMEYSYYYKLKNETETRTGLINSNIFVKADLDAVTLWDEYWFSMVFIFVYILYIMMAVMQYHALDSHFRKQEVAHLVAKIIIGIVIVGAVFLYQLAQSLI